MSEEKERQAHLDNINEPVEGESRSRNTRAEEAPEDNQNIYLTGDSTLQTPEEFHLDKETEHTDELIVSGVDDAASNSDGLAGTDRAGTAERKDLGPSKLNQGLEDQGAQMTYELDPQKEIPE